MGALLESPLVAVVVGLFLGHLLTRGLAARKVKERRKAVLATLLEEMLANYDGLSAFPLSKHASTSVVLAHPVSLYAGRAFLPELGSLPVEQARPVYRAYAACEDLVAAAAEFAAVLPGSMKVGHPSLELRRRVRVCEGGNWAEYQEFKTTILPKDGNVHDPEFTRGRAFVRFLNAGNRALSCLQLGIWSVAGGQARLEAYEAECKQQSQDSQ